MVWICGDRRFNQGNDFTFCIGIAIVNEKVYTKYCRKIEKDKAEQEEGECDETMH